MKKPHTLITALFVGLGLGLSHVASAAPATLVQPVTYSGQTITMRLTLQNLRGANFQLRAQNAAGTYDTLTPVEERSYIGTVDEFPDAIASGIIQDDGQFRGAVYFDRGSTWFTLASAVQYTRGMWQPSSFGLPGWTTTPGQAGTTMYGFDVGIDASYNYMNARAGNSVAKAFELIEFSVAATRALYMQDTLTRPYLGRVILRTSQTQDPANGLGGGTYLDAVRNHWNNNQQDANRDVVAGLSAGSVGGGLAWVGVIGTGSAYSVNDSGADGEFTIVWRHELGHNWGINHYDGGYPEGGTINSDNQYARMNGAEAANALNHRNSRPAGVLDNLGTYTTVNIPPYASIDTAVFTQGEDTQLTLNVVANDHDANGQALTLISVQAATAQGGTASIQGGMVIYKPKGNFLGVDSFSYKIQDSSGQTATGAVAVDVQSGDRLRLSLALNETTGTSTDDASVFDRNGTLYGTDFPTATVAGRYGNAVNLDGVDDHVRADGVKLNSNTVTLAAWIKPGASSNPWSGIIFDRSNSANGIGIGDNGELRYHWNNAQWNWNSGLIPAANTWTFVALVVEPGKATLYMNNGSGFQSAVNTVTHAAAKFGSVYIGRDPSQTSRHFRGAIDDARIYNEALTVAGLQKLFDGGTAEAPSPFDGATEVGPGATLTWAPSSAGVQYHVYLGTTKTAVQNATTASPEYKGSVTAPSFVDPGTTALSTNYWRIDTQTALGTTTGNVWTFTRDNNSGIAIANASFETGPSTGVPTSWTLTAGSSSSLGVAAGGSNGSQFLYIGPGVSLTQDLVYTLTNGEALTLKYDSSRTHVRNIQLLAKNGGTYTLMAETTAAIGSGSWNTATLNYTVAASYAGQQLALRIISGNWNEFDNFRLTTIPAANNTPTWTTNPVVEIGATEASNYNSTLANDATDLDNDPLTYSKVSGPTWLSVASNGALSGTPGSANVGVNNWTVRVTDSKGASADATLQIQVSAMNHAPVFNANPLVKPDAMQASAYSGSITGAASDVDNDPLTFNKNSGPAWLTVASNGTLSGTPGAADVGINQWSVSATDPGSLSATTTLRITVAALPVIPVSYGPTSQTTTYGSVTSGGTSQVLTSDNSYEVLREAQTGTTTSNRVSRLQHSWKFDIGTGGSAVALDVEAYHSVNTEGDDFIFSWSSNGTTFTDVITVTKTADNDQVQTANLPANLTGPVWIQVRDANRTPGKGSRDRVYIDRLNLRVTP